MLIYKLPFQNKFYTLDSQEESSVYSINSFCGDRKILFFGNPKEITTEELDLIQFQLPISVENTSTETKEKYLDKISKAIQIIKENQLSKIVIARKKPIEYSGLDFGKTFSNLCESYPTAFVYAFCHNGIAWMGAFSEALGIYDKKNKTFRTMSLAGTLPVDENWTTKEIEEQLPVTEYISTILKKYSTSVLQSETYDHISGNIKHLRTDFEINLEKEKVESLLKELHPTPAVCGIPKEECKKWIKELEDFDREYYAGYNQIETEDFLYAFVNLRCGKFFKNRVDIFVGGGITQDSNPENEWRETELKSHAIINNLAIKQP